MHNLSPFVNELIKHKPKEEQDDMHEIKIRVFHKAYKQVFKQLYIIIMLRFIKQEWILTRRPVQDNKQVAMS
jgi:hypothetical protein